MMGEDKELILTDPTIANVAVVNILKVLQITFPDQPERQFAIINSLHSQMAENLGIDFVEFAGGARDDERVDLRAKKTEVDL